MLIPKKSIAIIVGLLLLSGAESPSPTRSYHLGFTPFPYDISQAAIDYVYTTIGNDADIIAHHFDEGVPWPQALAGSDYLQNVLDDWEQRKSKTPAGHKVYVAITPINTTRNGLALYWGSDDNLPLLPPWNGYAFNHDDVKTAYLNHAIRTIDYFEPDYFTVGIEVNLLVTNNPGVWSAYLELNEYVYAELKRLYPNLPVMVSLFGIALLDGYRGEDDHAAQMQAFAEIIDDTDYYAISLYPYMSVYLTNSIPATMFDDLFSLSDKPIAIAETGYPAQSFSITVEGGGNIEFNSTPEKQRNYIAGLLEQADQRKFEFVINFVLRDYDALWEAIGSPQWAIVWRDTGFYDENGVSRPALDIWRDALAHGQIDPSMARSLKRGVR